MRSASQISQDQSAPRATDSFSAGDSGKDPEAGASRGENGVRGSSGGGYTTESAPARFKPMEFQGAGRAFHRARDRGFSLCDL